MRAPSSLSLLNIAAYLTVVGAAVSAVIQIDLILLRWQVALLLAGFVFLYSRLPQDPQAASRSRTANLLIAVQALIVIYLIWVTRIGFSFFVLFFILSVSAALYNSLRFTLVWIGMFVLITAGASYLVAGWPGTMSDVGVFAAGYLFFGAITNALSAARITQMQNERLLAELQAKNARLESYARQAEDLAALEERNRLAREVHDTLGHRLTSSSVQLEAAQRLVPVNPDKAAELVGVVRQQVREALQELRQMVGRLRAPLELELSLVQALRRLAEGFQSATGLVITLDLPNDPCEVPPTHRLALYRAAQEGLTNVQRHARATQAWLRLACTSEEIRLEVRDNGQGVADASISNGNGSFGLRGMQERAAALGGRVELKDVPGSGALLSVILPLASQPAAE